MDAMERFVAANTPSAALLAHMEARRRFRERLSSLRTFAFLKRNQPQPAKLAALGDAALAFAAQNPDHSKAGQEAARAALEARVGAQEASRLIAHVIDDAPPASTLTAADLERDDSVFWGRGRWLRRIVGWVAGFSAVALCVGVFLGTPVAEMEIARAVEAGVVSPADFAEARRVPATDEAPPPGQTSPLSTLDKLRAISQRPEVAPYTPFYRILDRAGSDAFGWSMVLFPLWTLLICVRGKPARILLLRRFNDRSIGASVSRFSRRWLTPYGHVYSLADKVMKRNWLGVLFSWFSFNPLLLLWRVVNIPIAMARRMFNRAVAGPIMIWNGRDYRNFAGRMIDHWGLNLEMQRTQRRAILVRTSDAWWKQVVLMLMHGADAIVVDVTEVAAGTAWELETMLHEAVGERVVFVARADGEAHARAALSQYGFADAALHIYKKNGAPRDGAAFREAVRAAMLRRLQEAPRSDQTI